MLLPAVEHLLSILGVKDHGLRPGWVTFSCPFAFWTHAGSTDSSPSFGISFEANSRAHCFSCPETGSALGMVMRLVEWQKKQPNPRYTNEQLKEAVEFVSQEEPEDSTSEFDFPSFDSLQEINTVKPLIPFPEDWLSSFLSGANHVYRVSRGISLETAYRFDIRYDTLLKRLCFPLRSITGTLYGMQGRDVTGKQQPKYHFYDYKGIKNPVVWGNEQHVDLSEPLIITEGFPDAAKIDTAGFRNVVACLTSKFSRHKYERLQDAKNIITFFDYGTGGDTGRLLVERYWKHAHVMHVIPDEEEKDAGNMSVEAIQEVLHGLV